MTNGQIYKERKRNRNTSGREDEWSSLVLRADSEGVWSDPVGFLWFILPYELHCFDAVEMLFVQHKVIYLHIIIFVLVSLIQKY